MVPGMTHAANIFEQIQARRAQIAHQRTILLQQQEQVRMDLAALERQEADLATTERTVAMLLPEGDEPVHLAVVAAGVLAQIDPVQTKQRQRRKPANIPTIIKMTREILRASSAQGEPWMDKAEIVAQIRQKWWADVRSEDILPQLWRAAEKQGVLKKDGDRYGLPYLTETSVEVAAGSHSEGPH